MHRRNCWTDKTNVSKNGRIIAESGRYHQKRRGTRKESLPLQDMAKLKIRRARKAPKSDCPFSHTAMLIENGKSTFYIHFHEQNMLQLVGNIMPVGVSYFKPAYLKIVWRELKQQYDVLCCYVDKSFEILLWSSPTLPKWAEPIYPVSR